MTRRSIIVLVGAVFLMVLLGGGLWSSNAICIERTGKEPDGKYFSDPAAFRAEVSRVRDGVLTALERQFDEESGFFVYNMNPNGAVSSNNNAIRQLLASRILALESQTDEDMRELHAKNLEAIFKDWYREEGEVGFVYFDEKSKLGANAMLLRVLVASPEFNRYEAPAKKLAEGVLSLMNEDGSFSPWYVEPSYDYDGDYLLTFYSGEAVLALLEYAAKTGDDRVFSRAVDAENYYIGEYVERMDENYYPAYVPWHTQALALLYENTHDQKYADAIYALNDRLLELQDRERYVGRFSNPALPEYGNPHAASDAVYTEGLAHAYRIARQNGDVLHEQKFHDAVIYGTYNLASLQHEREWWRFFDDVEASMRLQGGIKTTLCNRFIRIDTNAHAIDALTEILAVWP